MNLRSKKPFVERSFLVWSMCVAALFSTAGISSIAQAAAPRLVAVAHVAIRVSDVQAELQFFNKLGFEQAFTHDQNGRTAFVFVKVNDTEFLEIHPPVPVGGTNPLPLGFNHICFVTTDAKAEHAQWAEAGLNPTDVAKGPDGTSEFGAKDPSGAMTEALEVLPDSQPAKDKGQHLGSNRVSSWLMGVDLPVADTATWQRFYEGIGFVPRSRSSALEMISPAEPNLAVSFHPAAKSDRPRILFAVKNARKVADQLRRAGLYVELDGGEISLSDPDGNVFALMEQAQK